MISQERMGASMVEHYYDEESHVEWRRLERHRTEFAVTIRTLIDYLPPAPQAILDDGGGPGRYALALSSLGYQVTLLDLSQSNLNFAQQKAQESKLSIHQYMHGNALNLSSFCPKSFDVVLLLGPLYHLQTEPERLQAVREAWHVLRPGGLIFTAFITRYAAFRDLAKNSPATLLAKRAEWKEILRTGVYHAGQGVGFTASRMPTLPIPPKLDRSWKKPILRPSILLVAKESSLPMKSRSIGSQVMLGRRG